MAVGSSAQTSPESNTYGVAESVIPRQPENDGRMPLTPRLRGNAGRSVLSYETPNLFKKVGRTIRPWCEATHATTSL